MADLMPIPEELQHLIEKRSGAEQRVEGRREPGQEQAERAADQPLDSDADDRRSADERRQDTRREGDATTL